MDTDKNKIPLFRHKSLPTVHWKDSNEMHQVMHSFPNLFNSILLELLDGPMSRHEIRNFLNRIVSADRRSNKLAKAQLDLESDLERACKLDVLTVKEGQYHLTPAGREIAEHMQLVIPAFMKWVFSPRTVSLFSLGAHVVLSLLKLGIGYFSRSAGLLADGIDNTVDTFSSLMVLLGIKYNKEKLASIFIIITMFLSVGGIALTSLEKVMHLEPVRSGITAFFVSLICGLVMLGLSSYQYLAGKKSSNLAIMCQSVDSRNHFWTSLLVCCGILFSFLASAFEVVWLHYADVLASVLIGFLIFKGAIELARVFHKEAGEGLDVSHFMKALQERHREKILFDWIRVQLHSQSLAQKVLEEKFTHDFCEDTPKIMTLTEFGYMPESGIALRHYLDKFVKQKKLLLDDGKYWLIA